MRPGKALVHPSRKPLCGSPVYALSCVRACVCGRVQVEILVRLKGHPNIVSIEDVFEDQSGVHIVQELCSGGPLTQRIAQQVSSRSWHHAADMCTWTFHPVKVGCGYIQERMSPARCTQMHARKWV